jgi:hypothetical protein
MHNQKYNGPEPPEPPEFRTAEVTAQRNASGYGSCGTTGGTLAGPGNLARENSVLFTENELFENQKKIEESERRFRKPVPYTNQTYGVEISHPAHYCRGGIECRHVIEAWGLPYHLGTALAYICRAYHKGAPGKDIAKAIQHLQFEFEAIQREKSGSPSDPRTNPPRGNLPETWGETAGSSTTCSRHLGYMPGA